MGGRNASYRGGRILIRRQSFAVAVPMHIVAHPNPGLLGAAMTLRRAAGEDIE